MTTTATKGVDLPERTRRTPETIIDPEGDLWLVVGSTPAEKFLVSSKVLKLASPVFHVRLRDYERGGDITPSTNDFEDVSPIREICLPDDNPDTMRTILQVVHFKTNQLPEDTGYDNYTDTVFNLAVLCDKYDMIGALRMMFNPWLENYRNCTEDYTDQDKGLYIAWVTGKQDVFAHLLEAVIRCCGTEMADDGILYGPCSGGYITTELRKMVPMPLADHICSERLNRLGKLLEELNRIYKALLSERESLVFNVLGAFVQSMHLAGIIPLGTTPETLTCSVYYLEEKLGGTHKLDDLDREDDNYFQDDEAIGCLKRPWEFFKRMEYDPHRDLTPLIPTNFSIHLQNQAAK